MSRIKIGDLFEIITPRGKAYLHYVHQSEDMGELIRVLPNLYEERPNNLQKIVDGDELFYVFFPLKFAFKNKIVDKVGNFDSSKYDKPQFMKTEHVVQDDFLGWYIVNTDTWQREFVESLNENQKELSPWGIWNDTLLIEKLSSGWNLQEWNLSREID